MQAQPRLMSFGFPPAMLIGLPERGPLHPASTSCRTAHIVQARGGRGEQGRLQQGVQQAPQPVASWLASTPWYVSVPAALLAAGLAMQLLKRLRGQQGSLNDLQYRGLVSDERGMVNHDPSYDKAMKSVRTMKIEELTEEQIMAARRRRSREREGDAMDLSTVELPPNHPFAVAEQVSAEEEELQRARLNVRRGPPLQDLSGTRGFPEDRPPQAPARRPRPA